MELTVRTQNVDLLFKLGNGLKRQFELQKFCDVTLTTTNQESPQLTSTIECHKVVLSSSSRYFEHYITDYGDEVNMIDVSPLNIDVMKEVLAFLYNGECLIRESNVFKMLDTARRWVVPELATDCCRYMVNSLTVHNVCYFYEALSKFDYQVTSAKLCYFIREHFIELHENKQISCLSLRSFNKIIAFDDIHVDNEDVIFQSAEMILEKSAVAVDQKDLAKCWKLIRFEFMSMPYLVDTVMFHDLLRDPPQRNYVKRAIAYNHKETTINSNRLRRTWNGGYDPDYVVWGPTITAQVDNSKLTYINGQNMVCWFNKIKNRWEEIMRAPDWIDHTTVVASCPDGLIVAGKKCETNGKKVSLLDLHNRCEINYPNLPQAVYGCAICCRNNTVYLVGGNTSTLKYNFWNWCCSKIIYIIQQTETSWVQYESIHNIEVENPVVAPNVNESCYFIDSNSVYKFNFATCFSTALTGLQENYNPDIEGVVVYKNRLTVFKYDRVMTLENQRWIMNRYYEPLYGLKQVMIYDGEIHACVVDGDTCKIMKYDSENILWKDTKIPTFPKSKYSHQMTIT